MVALDEGPDYRSPAASELSYVADYLVPLIEQWCGIVALDEGPNYWSPPVLVLLYVADYVVPVIEQS